LGVRFFFTISGFLITWLMTKEEEQLGFVSLKRFYARRALRILPVYVACLIVLEILQLSGVALQNGYWLKLLTFTRNFDVGNSTGPLISGHLWSLSVEEQFYLVWPGIFLILGRSLRKRIGFLLGMVLFTAVWKVLALLGCYNSHLWFAFGDRSTFLYLDCIAYGCLGAILMHTEAGCLKSLAGKFRVSVFLVSCSLIVGPEIGGMGKGLQNIGFLLLLLQSVLLPDFAPFRILNHQWMVKIGVLSYSLYIWQQLVFCLWPFSKLWFLSLPAAFMPAWLSYVFLEKPFFSLRAKFRAHGGD
jgi:peptidoglycan/LPS O-acetylase OafA/YrhL